MMLKALFLLTLSVISSNVLSQADNTASTKINIQSDHYKMFNKGEESGYILSSNVHITNINVDIKADKAEILTSKSGTMKSAIFTGTPVYCLTKGLKEQQLDATSDSLDYQEAKGIIIFKGNVTIKRDNTTFEGPEFIYHIKDKTLNGGQTEGRFHLELSGEAP